jgi:ribosomal protein L11 methyltransferase
MKWIEIKIKTTTEAIEAVANIFYDVGVAGVVIEDPNDLIFKEKEQGNWDYIDESIFNREYEGAIVKAYIPEGEDLLDKIEFIKENIERIPLYDLDKGSGEITTSEIYEEDWSNAWKKYYKPKKIGEKIVIKPSWEHYEATSEETIIELDPGMAFGTGTHETTMMCIQNLEKYVRTGSTVFDIGCGSGILSIVAAKLGASKVIGVDIGKVAIKVSQKNVVNNKVENKVEIKQGNLMEAIEEQADIIVSNIVADVIIELIPDIVRSIKKDGVFIASGIIIEKINSVTNALESNQMRVVNIDKKGEWAAIVSKLG